MSDARTLNGIGPTTRSRFMAAGTMLDVARAGTAAAASDACRRQLGAAACAGIMSNLTAERT